MAEEVAEGLRDVAKQDLVVDGIEFVRMLLNADRGRPMWACQICQQMTVSPDGHVRTHVDLMSDAGQFRLWPKAKKVWP